MQPGQTEQEKHLTESIYEILKNASFTSDIGIGAIYDQLTMLSVSWLESLDNIKKVSQDSARSKYQTSVSCMSDTWKRFFTILSNGNEAQALEEFNLCIHQYRSDLTSFLMQKYLISTKVTLYMLSQQQAELCL